MNELLAAALGYAACGWRVVQLHTPTPTGCTCKHGAACNRAGKHPRWRAWQNIATCDADLIRGWWAGSPDANVGIVGGDGLVVLDLDDAGEETLQALAEKHGAKVPATYTVGSGSGGRRKHLYFLTEATFRNGEIAPGIEVVSDRSLVVAPRSLHASGARYVVIDDREPAPLQAWLHQECGNPRTRPARKPRREYSATSAADSSIIAALQDPATMERIAAHLGVSFPERFDCIRPDHNHRSTANAAFWKATAKTTSTSTSAGIRVSATASPSANSRSS